ncbi:hypothetical protein L486_02066 [Kwoniella mangroviensis CBS 10435]|uniref:Uncharacterized protein n=1 Tax=Kwoniella mangroviensis CBS 10435 TaxID=1331196 RepID=A0A1B9IV41_9TREE|nr:uncharacterized protein I203_04770 [Kwoniella mangroviensis CBS 8507]OCF59401.1 hypothetical protein L486_02066 [Kwoniella mangroviensis CBS 10435]OCF66437.1 hypothetical protein I203_04770 [Kwoniella mangroviensis CBS 8507]
MSTSAEIPIDPSLRDSSSATSPTRLAGTKRKTRGSGPSTTSASSPRVTRRSTAHNEGNSIESAEPARGEEENLNGYWGPGNPKRAKRSSPTKRSKPTTSSTPSSNQVENVAGPSGIGEDSGSGVGPSISVIGELAGLANRKSSSSGIFPYFPLYPVGLTPFRYPCLTPSEPNPPPGDPNNPNFKSFNPHESNITTETTGASTLPSQNQLIDPQLAGLSGSTHTTSQQQIQPVQQSQQQSQIHLETNSNGNNNNNNSTMMDQNTAASADAAYESISALLSASQGIYPTLDSIDYNQGRGQGQGQ